MRLAITGASGFIGQAFVKRLMEDGEIVRATGAGDPPRPRLLSSSATGIDHLRSKWPAADIVALHDGNGNIRSEALAGADVLLHLGWSSVPGTAKSDPISDLRTNVEGGIRLLRAIASTGVGQVIFVSTGGMVYGEPRYLPIDERHPVLPRTPYGASKLLFEHYLRCMSDLHGFRHLVLRPANVYGRIGGPQKRQGVVENWLTSVAKGRSVRVWNGMDVVRDYVHVDDLVATLLSALHYEGDHRIFNVGTGVGTSLSELASIIERITGRAIEIDQAGSTPPDVRINILDPTLMWRELGIRPTVGLEEGIRRTWSGLLTD